MFFLPIFLCCCFFATGLFSNLPKDPFPNLWRESCQIWVFDSTWYIYFRSQLPDWKWAQCDNCLSWRRLPTGYSKKLPDKWFCYLNPDAHFKLVLFTSILVFFITPSKQSVGGGGYIGITPSVRQSVPPSIYISCPTLPKPMNRYWWTVHSYLRMCMKKDDPDQKNIVGESIREIIIC